MSGGAEPGAAEERLRRFYDARAGEEPEHDPEAALRFRKAVALASPRQGERVLDIGAKWGGLGLHLRERGYEVGYLGLDLSQDNIARAAALGLDVRPADVARPLPVEAGAVGCVFCLELLEHLVTPLRLIEEIARVLAPDGRAVISVPSPYNWIEVYREWRFRPDPEGHLASLTTPVLANLLALAGLKIARRGGTGVRLPRTLRQLSVDGMAARSRLYLVRPEPRPAFAGRRV